MGASLHTHPTGLGSLTLFKSIVQSPLLCGLIKDTYLLVAGLLQEVKHPIMNKTSPCLNVVDWSSGNICNKTAANGIAEPELI
ncbi:unnamed protein product [Prunus brigantina]